LVGHITRVGQFFYQNLGKKNAKTSLYTIPNIKNQ